LEERKVCVNGGCNEYEKRENRASRIISYQVSIGYLPYPLGNKGYLYLCLAIVMVELGGLCLMIQKKFLGPFLWKTGANCWATRPPSAPCSTASCITGTC
jgi:hypothetical protein